MKVTLDIPDGYEAKVVKVSSNDEIIFGFFVNHEADHAYVANAIFETAKTLYGRVGWTGFRLHSTPCTDGRTQHNVTAYKE